MNGISRIMVSVFFTMTLALVHSSATKALAESSFFVSEGCSGCHTAAAATCNGCHAHGTHPSSAKSAINVSGTTNKTSYSPGETVTVTITGGYRTGWIRAVLYNQNTVELARSKGNASGMGGAAIYPVTLTAPAPATAGSYVWKVAWYGNQYDVGVYGNGWTADPGNPDHGYEIVSMAPFTVAAAPSSTDTTAPLVNAFTLPSTSTSLTLPVTTLSATDNVAVTGYMITTSSVAPTASSSGWSATPPSTVTAPNAGSTTFYAWAKDAAGNVSAGKSATVVTTTTTADSTVPMVSTFTLPSTSTNLTIPVTAFAATDNVGVTGYMITTSSVAPTANATGWSDSPPSSVTAPGAGSTTFYAWTKDAAGNVSAGKSATVVTTTTAADSTAPTISAFTLPTTSTSLTVPVTALTATDNVGVTGYMITTSSVAPAAGANGWSATPPASVTAPSAGSTTFYAWAKDAAGNVSAGKSATVTTATATSGDLQLTVSTLADGSLTSNGTLNIQGMASSPAGIDSVTVNDKAVASMPNGAFTYALVLQNGPNVVTVVAIDKAGNKKSDVRTINYDAVAPIVDISAPADNSTTVNSYTTVNGTFNETSTVTVAVNDGTPQSASITGNAFTTTVNLVPGVNTIYVRATDLAGNTTSAKRSVSYVSNKFTLAVKRPSQDITTRRNTILLKGTVTNSSKNITVTITMDGKTYKPAVKEGVFSQQLNFTTPKLYTIIVTAKDDAGNTGTVSRNVIYRPQYRDVSREKNRHRSDDKK